MGQEINQQEMFIGGLRQALKIGRERVKIKQSYEFFDYIKNVCPWPLYEGTIDEKIWKRVGEAPKDYYQAFGCLFLLEFN